MSIKTTYNLHGIEVQDAIIRIERLWGSSREGWTSLVSVNTVTEIPATEAVGVEGEEDYVPAAEARTEWKKLDEFNRTASYVEGELPYTTMYEKLTEEFGGIKVTDAEIQGTVRVPSQVTMRQARLQLLSAGLLDAVNMALENDPTAKIEWEYATHVHRNSLLISGLQGALGLTDEQVDEMFIAAKAL